MPNAGGSGEGVGNVDEVGGMDDDEGAASGEDRTDDVEAAA